VGATVDTITLLARAYGGPGVGDLILKAAHALGQLGRGGRAGIPAQAHVRTVSTIPTVPLVPTPPLAAGASTRAGAAHFRSLGGNVGGGGGDAGRPICPDCCERPASLPSPETLKKLDTASPSYDPKYVWPKYCGRCRAARKAADAGKAARPTAGASAAAGRRWERVRRRGRRRARRRGRVRRWGRWRQVLPRVLFLKMRR
jgi:hypothetical protein